MPGYPGYGPGLPGEGAAPEIPNVNHHQSKLLCHAGVVQPYLFLHWPEGMAGLKPFWYMLRVIYSTLIILFRVKVLKMDEGVGLKSADKI